MNTKQLLLISQLFICIFIASCVSSETIIEPESQILTNTLTSTVVPTSTVQPTNTSTPTPTKDIYLIEVIMDNVSIRSCPLPSCETVHQIDTGYPIRAIGRNDIEAFAWYKVEFDLGKNGWVMDNARQINPHDDLWNNLPEIAIAWDTPTPYPSPTIDLTNTLTRLCNSNVYDPRNFMKGQTVRFDTPIDINTKGRPEVLAAIENFETLTGGAVAFNVVDENPDVGLTIIIGDSKGPHGNPSCGSVTDGPSALSNHLFRTYGTGTINRLFYVHLGSSECDHTEIIPYLRTFSAITEHELAHAIGIGEHFDGFYGNEGLSANLNAVVTLLYSILPGTDMSSECSGN